MDEIGFIFSDAFLNITRSYDEWLDFEGRFECLGWTPSATYLGIRISDVAEKEVYKMVVNE